MTSASRRDERDEQDSRTRGKVHEDMTTSHLLDEHPAGQDEDLDMVRAHRPDVVRRLLARGLSPATLDQILPGWSELADE